MLNGRKTKGPDVTHGIGRVGASGPVAAGLSTLYSILYSTVQLSGINLQTHPHHHAHTGDAIGIAKRAKEPEIHQTHSGNQTSDP